MSVFIGQLVLAALILVLLLAVAYMLIRVCTVAYFKSRSDFENQQHLFAENKRKGGNSNGKEAKA